MAEIESCPTCNRPLVEVYLMTSDLYVAHREVMDAWCEANGMDLPNTPVVNDFTIGGGQVAYWEFAAGDRRRLVKRTVPLVEPWPLPKVITQDRSYGSSPAGDSNYARDARCAVESDGAR